MIDVSLAPKLDPNEQHFRIPGPCDGLSLFLRLLPTIRTGPQPHRAVHSPLKRDIKIGRGTHLMHLEQMRLALWQESIGFLRGGDVAVAPEQRTATAMVD